MPVHLEPPPIAGPSVGDQYTIERVLEPEDVRTAATLGAPADAQPAEPESGERGVIRGLLTATIVSGVGRELGLRLRELHVHFLRPAYGGDRVRCTWETRGVNGDETGWSVSGGVTVERTGGSDGVGGRGETREPSVLLEASVEGRTPK